MNFPVVYKPCPCSIDSFRKIVKNWLNEIEKFEPNSKLNIVEKFLKIKPLLTSSQRIDKINYCKKCGEPSSKEICKPCQMFSLINKTFPKFPLVSSKIKQIQPS
jgi:uncharacterized protein (TIGR00269 family)